MNSQIVRYKRSILTALLALLASAVVAHANDFAVQGSLAGHGIGVVEGGTLRAPRVARVLRRTSGYLPTL